MAAIFDANFPTEEAFVQATFREFVKLWGNGSQAHLQVQCLGGHAWVQLMSALGPPSSPHLFRRDDHHHGYHGPHQRSQHRRRKGAKQRDRDRARAALHRASLLQAAAAPAAAPETLHHAPQPLLPPSHLLPCQDDLPEYHPHHTDPPLPVPELTHHGDDPVPPQNVNGCYPPHQQELCAPVEDELSVDQSDSDDRDVDDDELSEHLWNISFAMESSPHPAQSDLAFLAGLGHALSPHGQRGLHPEHVGLFPGGQLRDKVGLPLPTVGQQCGAVSLPPPGGQQHGAVGLPLPDGQQCDAGLPLGLTLPVDHLGPLPDVQPHGAVSGWTSEDLPAEEQIAEMSHEELLRFAGGGNWR